MSRRPKIILYVGAACLLVIGILVALHFVMEPSDPVKALFDLSTSLKAFWKLVDLNGIQDLPSALVKSGENAQVTAMSAGSASLGWVFIARVSYPEGRWSDRSCLFVFDQKGKCLLWSRMDWPVFGAYYGRLHLNQDGELQLAVWFFELDGPLESSERMWQRLKVFSLSRAGSQVLLDARFRRGKASETIASASYKIEDNVPRLKVDGVEAPPNTIEFTWRDGAFHWKESASEDWEVLYPKLQ